MPKNQAKAAFSGIQDKAKLWTNAVIPYTIDCSIGTKNYMYILIAISEKIHKVLVVNQSFQKSYELQKCQDQQQTDILAKQTLVATERCTLVATEKMCISCYGKIYVVDI